MTNIVIKNSRLYIALLFFPIIFISKIIRYTHHNLVSSSGGHVILSLMSEGLRNHVSDSTFTSAARFFKAVNFLQLTSFFQFEVAITVVFNISLLWILRRTRKDLTLIQAFFWIFSIALLNIFAFTIAKEPIQMIFFLAMYYILQEKKLSDKMKFFLMSMVILLCALIFRAYYVLVFIFVVTFAEVRKVFVRGSGVKQIIAFFLISSILYAIMLWILQLFLPEYHALMLHVARIGSEGGSTIDPLFSTDNNWLLTANYSIQFTRMLIPIELFTKGEPRYLLFVVFQLIVTLFLFCSLRRLDSSMSAKSIATLFFCGFVFCSAAFEYDFGAWVRHEAVAFPLLAFIVDLPTETCKKFRASTKSLDSKCIPTMSSNA